MEDVLTITAATVISQIIMLYIKETDMMIQKTKKAWNAIQDFFKNFNK